ncbi:MAG TPA: hypothetical protein VFW38_06610 [Solirubrobacteraceae bacterium]|nr:hypothetical protein [Solirubrobacteraceae bacterium]
MTDFLAEKRREITDRMAELKPLINEYNQLEAAARALAGVGGRSSSSSSSSSSASTPAPVRRGPGRPRGSTNKKAATRATGARRGRPPKAAAAATTAAASTSEKPRRRAGRRKGSGTRAAQALQFVTGQPGITIPELAAKMGIKQNYLYRVLPGLEQEKKIKKQGRGWHPAS